MWNVFEYPWLLAAMSAGACMVIWILRCVYPDKVRRWTWLVPLLLIAAGFALDYRVSTDREKILITLKQLVASAEAQDVRAIDPVVSPEYSDSYHRSKARMLGHMRSRFSMPVFEEIRTLSLHVNSIENGVAAAGLIATVVFHPESSVAQVVGKSLIARVEFRLRRQADGQWLLSAMELKEVNKQPVSWRQASGQF
ncbi:MAG: hypothetical protein GY809_16905 [Planctomycetes bacterium]|nr:hypothetical protein [Planctomycetota bacterium]